MNDKYHQERSRLIQQHKEQIKLIEKEIKSKKGILKETSQKKLDEILKRQEQELREFESKYNKNEDKHQKNNKSNNNLTNKQESSQNHKNIVFEEKQWNSLSKSELETECKIRGINSKGSKEDLVTRLFIFTADQKSSMKKSDMSENKTSDINDNKVTPKFLNKATPPEINFANSGGTGRRKQRFQNRKVDHRKNVNPNQNSWAAFCARNDIPRKRDFETNEIESSNSNFDSDSNSNSSNVSSDSSSNSDFDSENEHTNNQRIDHKNQESEVDDEELAKRDKRRAVMIKVLEKMFLNMSLNEKKDGIELSKIEHHLTKLNVKNFRPELLGYKSIEDWISSQPNNIVTYDYNNKIIFPPGHKISNSSKNKNLKDDPYLVDSLSETSDNDYFM